ncbi:hypothetical protein QBC40DRAFT_149943, partial [Triangularia verruculosa]
ATKRALLPILARKDERSTHLAKLSEIIITINKGKSAQLVNLGMSPITATQDDSKANFANGVFEGMVPLLYLAAPRQFTIIVPTDDAYKHRKNRFSINLPLERPLVFNDYRRIVKYNELMAKAPGKD